MEPENLVSLAGHLPNTAVASLYSHKKKCAKHLIRKNGTRDLWRSPNHQYWNKKRCPFGGPVRYTGRKIPQIGAEWAVHASCSLQKASLFISILRLKTLEKSKSPICLAHVFCVSTSSQQQWKWRKREKFVDNLSVPLLTLGPTYFFDFRKDWSVFSWVPFNKDHFEFIMIFSPLFFSD